MKPVRLRSFAKINIGLLIGPPGMRSDGFHELRTVYQTIALHDTLTITATARRGAKSEIVIQCSDQRVPKDGSNTCYKAALRLLEALKTSAQVNIAIKKTLPVQGGLGAASSNAAATVVGLERALKKRLHAEDRLRIAGEVGSDVPLFLVGGTVVGYGRGEQVLPLADLPQLHVVVAASAVGVSTPQAFADWDGLFSPDPANTAIGKAGSLRKSTAQLTVSGQSDKLNGLSRDLYSWLSATDLSAIVSGVPVSGSSTRSALGSGNRNRAEALLLDLVRTGIENDFERVVFPQFPELRDVKKAIVSEGAKYASLSGSGSSVYGLFASEAAAVRAARRLNAAGIPAQATKTLSRRQYWKRLVRP